MKKIITISREFGSGGRTIGKLLAERLGYKFYDSEIVDKICKECGYHKDFVDEHSEVATSGNTMLFSLSRSGNSIHNSIYDEIYIAQRKVILDIYNNEEAVIVGRCADYILKDCKDVFNVFIYTDKERRKERIIQEYGENKDKSIEKRIKEKDKKREVYYKTYTGREFGDVHNYDVALDSKVGISKCVDILYNLIKE